MIRRLTVLIALICTLNGGVVWAQDASEEEEAERAEAPAPETPALPDAPPRPLGLALDALRKGDWDAAQALAERDGPIAEEIIEWVRLREGRGSYDEVTAFLERRSDWPGLDLLRRRSELAVSRQPHSDVLAFFAQTPPLTPFGALALAAALENAGRGKDAEALIVDIWREWRLSEDEQAEILRRYAKLLKPHHVARLDRMLWRGAHNDARQMFDLVDKGHTALAQARIDLRNMSKGVDSRIAAVPKALQSDPGLAQARFQWRMRKGRWDDAKELLLSMPGTVEGLGDPEAWADARAVLARDALREGNVEQAYRIAARHGLTEGADYAELEWISGYIALTRMKKPDVALEHFSRHDAAVVTPISRGRAGYWKGRALAALGRQAEADQEFTRAAEHQTSFYGLLAAEAAGLPFDVGLDEVPQRDWTESPLINDSVFQAGLLLAVSGERSMAEQFWRHLAETLDDEDAALLGQAAIDLGEPHLAVMIGKQVARRGITIPVPYYALHPLTAIELPVPTELALSIARRESEFDPVVVSGAGARGLMQLMPRTASEVARALKIGADHDVSRLTAEPVYNALLGTAYLSSLIDRFDGNIVMVSAGYNAGPSRPDRWMRDYGDPRGTDIETMIDWIENIPFSETRNYVMRVSESLPVYRARLGQPALPVPFSQELLGETLARPTD